MKTKKTEFAFIKQTITFASIALLMTACGGGGEDTPTSTTTETPRIDTSLTLASVSYENQQGVEIEVIAKDSDGSEHPVSVVSSDPTCANPDVSVTPTNDPITIIPTGNKEMCTTEITITSTNTRSSLSKTISVNVYDPMVMDIGNGLLIKYVNQYDYHWDDKDSQAFQNIEFLHPKTDTANHWYQLGSLFNNLQKRDYDKGFKVNIDGATPMIIVKDSTDDLSTPELDGKLLRHPTDYTDVFKGMIWMPTCPTKFVPLGVVGLYGMKPSTTDVVCVLESATAPATSKSIWDSNGWKNTSFSEAIHIWGAQPINPNISDDELNRLATGTGFVCSGYFNPCPPEVIKVLRLTPTQMTFNEDKRKIKLVENGLGEIVPNTDPRLQRFAASIRVPFTSMQFETGNELNTDQMKTAIETSPFMHLRRTESLQPGARADFRGLTTSGLLVHERANHTSTTETESSTKTISLSVTAGGKVGLLGSGGHASVTVSSELGWVSSIAKEYGLQTKNSVEVVVPAGEYLQFFYTTSTFTYLNEQGEIIDSVSYDNQFPDPYQY